MSSCKYSKQKARNVQRSIYREVKGIDFALSDLTECSQGLFKEQNSSGIVANEENHFNVVACSKMTKESLQKPVFVFQKKTETLSCSLPEREFPAVLLLSQCSSSSILAQSFTVGTCSIYPVTAGRMTSSFEYGSF